MRVDPSADGDERRADATAPVAATTLLVREGDIAADYLERLLDIVDYDGDIDLDVENDRAIVAIVGSGLQSPGRPARRDPRRAAGADPARRAAEDRDAQPAHARRQRAPPGASRRSSRALAAETAREVLANGEPVRLDADEPVRAQGRARRHRRDRRRAQRVRGRGAATAAWSCCSSVMATDRLIVTRAPSGRRPPSRRHRRPRPCSATSSRWRSGMPSCWLDDGVVRGLIGPREVPRLWERHLLNCAVLTESAASGCAGRRRRHRGRPARDRDGVRARTCTSTWSSRLLRRAIFLDRGGRRARHLTDRVRVVRGRAEDRAVRDRSAGPSGSPPGR